MVQWLVILLSVLLPFILVPLILPSLVLVAKRKNITDAPNYRKCQRRPVSVMGGMVVVSSITTALALASLYIDLNSLFPAICMIVLLMTVGLIDDSIGMDFKIKLVIQTLVAVLLCYVGRYRITSLWTVFGIEELSPAVSCIISILTGVVIMNAINFIDGIDGLASAFGISVSVAMAVWCIHHDDLAFSVFSLIVAGAMFSFWIFNGFSEKYKMYMGDSGSLVLGLYVYLCVCTILSHRDDPQLHLSNGYEVSFVMVLIGYPIFDFVRVVIGRLVRKQSPVKADRTHLHHILVDMGFSDLTAVLIIICLNLLMYPMWGWLIEMRLTHTKQLLIMILWGVILLNGPYFLIDYCRKHRAAAFHKFQVKVRYNRRWFSRRHRSFARFIDRIPTLI